MIDKKRAIEIIRDILKKEEKIGLKLNGDCVGWDHSVITVDNAKHIGNVASLVMAFDITEKDLVGEWCVIDKEHNFGGTHVQFDYIYTKDVKKLKEMILKDLKDSGLYFHLTVKILDKRFGF